MATTITYKIDNTGLSDLGIKVSSATGLFSLPKLKEPMIVDWPDKNGVVVDLSAPRYQPREIVLNCFSSGATGAAAMAPAISLYNILTGSGLHTLSVTIGSSTYTYNVYCEEGIEPTKRWGGGKVIAEYAVKLIEPKPSHFVPSDT